MTSAGEAIGEAYFYGFLWFLGILVVLILLVPALLAPILNRILSKSKRAASTHATRIRHVDILIPTCVIVVVLFFVIRWRRDRHEEQIHQDTIRQFRAGAFRGEQSNQELKATGEPAP